jgi:hypothetical protein
MFTIARSLMRHKLLIITVFAVFGFLFLGNKEEPKPSSPWSTNATGQVAASSDSKKSSFTVKAFKALNGLATTLGVEEYMPTALRDQAIGNLDKTQQALTNATKQQPD